MRDVFEVFKESIDKMDMNELEALRLDMTCPLGWGWCPAETYEKIYEYRRLKFNEKIKEDSE